jgi:thiamine-monophosphate kinase
MNEFELIERYFNRDRTRPEVLVGIGDDAALIKPDPGAPMISALATLGAAPGDPADGGLFARALARTALNRLAAQGASPAWFTLALTLPAANSEWLEAFSAAIYSAIESHGGVLVGGDTTRGPTVATLIAHGTAPYRGRQEPTRPRPGDAVYLTGDLGEAAAQDDQLGLADPRPARIDEGLAAWPFTAAAGDLRESLAATLLRVIGGYGYGAEIDSAQLPVSPAREQFLKRVGGARLLVDASADPELCFVIGADDEACFKQAMAVFDSRCTRIGRVVNEAGVHLR